MMGIKVGTKRIWIKELLTLPSYLGSIIFGMMVLDLGAIGTIAIVLIVAWVSEIMFDRVFPEQSMAGRYKVVVEFIFYQMLFWGGVLFVAIKFV